MDTTRSGKETVGATKPAQPATSSRSPPNDPRPPTKKQRLHTQTPQWPAKKRSPVRVDHSPTPPTTATTTSPGALGNLPVELLRMIARSLPPAAVGPHRSVITPSPRPSQLYPLATTCKGFWECLRPLLFEFDIICHIRNWNPRLIAGRRWDTRIYGPELGMSALAWSIKNGFTPAAQTAIQVARSMGKLQDYISVFESRGGIPDNLFSSRRDRWKVRSSCRTDPLSQAIAKGNAPLVEMLTEGADTSLLSREWHDQYIVFPHRDEGGFRMTPLQLAIWMGQYEVAKVLLHRFAEVDQTTLKWNEPAGLGLASYLGYVDMARLMLEGEKGAVPESPWVAHIRSQLLDPRAYGDEHGGPRWPTCHTPPMILASVGSTRASRPPGGEAIFAILAAHDPKLVTKKYVRPSGPSRCPLSALLWVSGDFVKFRAPSILALIRAGALEPSLQPSPTATDQSQRFDEENRTPHEHLLRALNTKKDRQWKARRLFIGKCWDAALEYHGGTADDEFLKSWDEGIGNALPTKPLSKEVGRTPQQKKEIVWEMTMIVDMISALEGKHPGFAKLPTIRGYLDGVIFHRRSRRTFSHADLEGDWSHLMA